MNRMDIRSQCVVVRSSRSPARTTRERMLARLRSELRPHGVTLAEGTKLVRTWAGSSQRNEGAWSWYVDPPVFGEGYTVGSNYPMTVLLGCGNWAISRIGEPGRLRDMYVDPCMSCVLKFGRFRA